jgi:hypothetical protein
MGLTMSERAAVTKVKAQGYARADRRHLIHPQINADWGARIGRQPSVVRTARDLAESSSRTALCASLTSDP